MVSPRSRARGFAGSATFTTGIIEGTPRYVWPNARDTRARGKRKRKITAVDRSMFTLFQRVIWRTYISSVLVSREQCCRPGSLASVACESSVNFLELVAPRAIHRKMKIGRSHASVQFSRGHCNRILKLPPYFAT